MGQATSSRSQMSPNVTLRTYVAERPALMDWLRRHTHWCGRIQREWVTSRFFIDAQGASRAFHLPAARGRSSSVLMLTLADQTHAVADSK